MTIWNNLSGTTTSQFSIGKTGVTIWQGSTAPDNSMGRDGDLYLRTGASPGVYQRTEGYWQTVNDTFVRQVVPSGQTAQIDGTTNYVAIVGPAAGPSVLTLPEAIVGREITVKDETGAGATSTITISGATIDGQSSYTIQSNFGSVTLVCSGTDWFITRRA